MLQPHQLLLGFDGTSSSTGFCLTLATPPSIPGPHMGSEAARGRALERGLWPEKAQQPEFSTWNWS